MSKLSPRTQLLLTATKFVNADNPDDRLVYGEELGRAAAEYLTWPQVDTSQRYTLQLGYAAEKVAERHPRDWRLAVPAIREILDHALKEGRADDAAAAAEIDAGMQQWQQRADLR